MVANTLLAIFWLKQQEVQIQQQMILGLPDALFSPSQKKQKKIRPEKNFLYFRKLNFLNLRSKNLLYFLKRKLFFYFRKWNAALSGLRYKNFSLKKFTKITARKNIYFLKRKLFLYFLKKAPCTFWPLPPNTCSAKIYIFSKKLPIFWKWKCQKNPYLSGN